LDIWSNRHSYRPYGIFQKKREYHFWDINRTLYLWERKFILLKNFIEEINSRDMSKKHFNSSDKWWKKTRQKNNDINKKYFFDIINQFCRVSVLFWKYSRRNEKRVTLISNYCLSIIHIQENILMSVSRKNQDKNFDFIFQFCTTRYDHCRIYFHIVFKMWK
jgi:hypothetical protein